MLTEQYGNHTVSALLWGTQFVASVNDHVLAETFPTPETAIEFGKRYADELPADFDPSWLGVLRHWLKLIAPT